MPVTGVAPGDSPSSLEVLAKSFTAMAEAVSFHFEVDAAVKTSVGGFETTIPLTLFGDFQAPDRAHTKLTMSLGFFALEVETIAIGDTIYNTNPETGQWETTSNPAFGFLSPTEFTGGNDLALDEMILIGEVTIGGTQTLHLKGTAPADVFGGSQGKTEVEFWIGVDDSLIRKISAQVEISLEDLTRSLGGLGLSGPATLSMTMEFSDYGQPVVIEAPQVP